MSAYLNSLSLAPSLLWTLMKLLPTPELCNYMSQWDVRGLLQCRTAGSFVQAYAMPLLAAFVTVLVFLHHFDDKFKLHTRGPSDAVWSQVSTEMWQGVLDQMKLNPIDSQYQNSHNDTVLHLACSKDPPLCVVQTLIHSYPEACCVQNVFGCTPLHLAVRGCNDSVLRLLMVAYPQAVSILNVNGDSPMELLCWTLTEKRVISRTLAAEKPVCISGRLSRIWKNGCLLVMAAYCPAFLSGGGPGEDWNDEDCIYHGDGHQNCGVVHACAALQGCPPNFTVLAIRLRPEQLDRPDGNGDLPLHLALRNNKPWEGCIAEMLIVCRGSLLRKDRQSGLYPFMMAAIGDHFPLYVVYSMLRAWPEVERFTRTGCSS